MRLLAYKSSLAGLRPRPRSPTLPTWRTITNGVLGIVGGGNAEAP
jgi:hypothetical protein